VAILNYFSFRFDSWRLILKLEVMIEVRWLFVGRLQTTDTSEAQNWNFRVILAGI